MSDLLPCPFCGGSALRWKHRTGYLVCCDDSNCPGREANCTAERWNARAAPAPAGEPVAWRRLDSCDGTIAYSYSEFPHTAPDIGSRCIPRGSSEPLYTHPAPSARDEALEAAARVAYQACAETRHVSLGDKVVAAIRSLKGGGNG